MKTGEEQGRTISQKHLPKQAKQDSAITFHLCSLFSFVFELFAGERMITPLKRLEGRKFCVVFVKVIDASSERVQLQCLRGRASVQQGKVSVFDQNGAGFTLPSTAVKNILPSDGTALLEDAEYFCLVRVDDNISLVSQNEL